MSEYLAMFIIGSMESGRMGGQRLLTNRSCKTFMTLDYPLSSEDYHFNKVIIICFSYIIIIILIFS